MWGRDTGSRRGRVGGVADSAKRCSTGDALEEIGGRDTSREGLAADM